LAAAELAQQRAAASAAEKSEELQRAAERLEARNTRLQQATAELAEQRQAVQRRADHVDQCRAALDQLRGELENVHRDTLEIRLATEELWVQLSGAAPPAALLAALGRIRAKLARQYTQAAAELVERKKELKTIRGQLNGEHEKLVEHRLRLEQWAAQRQEVCQQQAARLVAREEELRREETWLREQSRRWQAERAAFQRELRRLRAKVAPPTRCS
jgi:chromosome segregation ATPase